MSGESCHMARPSRETSMTGASPVVALCRRPAAIPPAMAMPPARSPKAGRPADRARHCHAGVRALATPPRPQ